MMIERGMGPTDPLCRVKDLYSFGYSEQEIERAQQFSTVLEVIKKAKQLREQRGGRNLTFYWNNIQEEKLSFTVTERSIKGMEKISLELYFDLCHCPVKVGDEIQFVENERGRKLADTILEISKE